MRANQARFSIAAMARVLGVSPSGYYAWRQRPPSARARSDGALRTRVQAIHTRSRGTYGAPRIHAELAAGGVAASRKRVARVMRSAGIAGVSRRRGPRTTRRDVRVRPAADLVERRFEAEAPNRLWVADITCRRWPASSTWPSSSTCSAGGSSAGRWPDTCARRWCSMRWRWPWRNAGRLRSSIIPTRAASTRRWPSAPAAGNGAWRRRWVRSATASTMRWPRASSRRWSASCSTAGGLRPTPRRGRPCSSSWKGGTTRGAAIPRWATCRRWSSNVAGQVPLSAHGAATTCGRPRIGCPDRLCRLASAQAVCRQHPEETMANWRRARLRHRSADEAALWTCPACGRPVRVRAAPGGARDGRPQAVGNLAGERCRPGQHRGREIPTVPQRIPSSMESESVNLSTESGQPHTLTFSSSLGARNIGHGNC